MALIRNTLVFLDTKFFRDYETSDPYYTDILKYSQDDKIILCTSHICIEEWRTFQVNRIENLKKSYFKEISRNPIADSVLTPNPVPYPDLEKVEQQSEEFVKRFVADNKIQRLEPTLNHFKNSLFAYFRGLPPFPRIKERQDIPDSWIFEAAREFRFDEQFKDLKNRFCIVEDKNLKKHLSKLGFRPIVGSELLEYIRQEEESTFHTVEEQASGHEGIVEDVTTFDHTRQPITEINTLEDVLGTALHTDLKEIYIRILGYVFWLSSPRKERLFNLIEERGFRMELIKAGVTILSQESLGIIKDTGNYLLPVNTEICKEAADRVMDEVIGFLDQT